MHCTCTDINKFLEGLFAYVPSMISEEKTVGLCTGYRIVKGVNILQSQRCSSSSTRRIETYPARRKRFSKLTRATQQEQGNICLEISRFNRKSFWYKLKQHKCTKMVFTSSVVCAWATKTFLSEIIFFILKPTSSIQNNKNILGAYSSLFSQGHKTVYTSSENTCIEMSCIKMTSNPHTIFVLKISRQDNTISIWSLAPAGTYMFYKNKKIMWVISKHNCTWISDWIYVTMGSLSLY